ncbi:lysylphosphatidylglycerol synthase transmembrane domain-containing protein [Haliangium sp.]|uniref:lysylphosphatidylglycerol synthase transmembrane domain-containing protein n=1 Tax=Haliangium sp. TaxID=2663208 RepID=UPI003D0EECF4
MKLAINIVLSLVMLAICLFLVWPAPEDQGRLGEALARLDLLYLAGFLGVLAVVHFFRSWRWNYLLAPLGVRLGAGRLLAVSSVGFMAILALPARLGEFVRPALLRKKGEISATAVLGTVAVERIIDGLLVSLLVFAAFFALRGPGAPGWMMPTAYAALGVFSAALVFLGFAMRWPQQTVTLAVTLTGARWYAPRLADVLREKLLNMISGFLVMSDRRNLAWFALWSLVYWLANGVSLWVLAQGFGLELSVVGAFATMGLVAVGITLPNSPGLVGQFQWFTQLGLSLYLGEAVGMGPDGLAFAIVLHGGQVVWYMLMGGLALATPYVSLRELWSARVDERETLPVTE